MSTYNPTETPGIYSEEPPTGGPKGFIALQGSVSIDDQFGFVLRAVNDTNVTLTGITYHFTIQRTAGGGSCMPNGPSGVTSTLSGIESSTGTATGLELQLSGHSLPPGATVRLVVADWVAKVAGAATLTFWMENAQEQAVPEYATSMTVTAT